MYDILPQPMRYLSDNPDLKRVILEEAIREDAATIEDMLSCTQESFRDEVMFSQAYLNLRNIEYLKLASRFWKESKQIFVFDPSLLNALDHTDVSDIPLDFIQLPHDLMYIHFGYFGGNHHVSSNGLNEVIDGVFVQRREDPNGNPKLEFDFSYYRASENNPKIPLPGQSISDVPMARFSLDLSGSLTVKQASLESIERQKRQAMQLDQDLTSAALFMGLRDPRFKASKPCDAARLIEAGYHAFAQASLNVTINALLYLSQKPRLETRYPRQAPKRLLRKLKNEKSERKSRVIHTDLLTEGFTTVHYTIEKLDLGPSPTRDSKGLKVRPHLRRGHWRNQAHGPQRSQHKWIWVRPCLINPDDGEVKGTIHKI